MASVGQSSRLALLQYFMEVKNYIIMTKSISCKDAEKDCTWSASSENEEELMSRIKEHVLAEHKEIEWNPKNIEGIKSLIKVTKRFWWWG